MKISYISNLRMPTEKAYGLQIMKLCEALSKRGHTISLVFPKASNHITKDVFDYYKIKQDITIEYRSIPRLSFRIRSLVFMFSLLFTRIDLNSRIITRDAEIAWLYSIRGYQVYYYAHNWPSNKNRLFVRMLRKVSGIICNSNGTEKKFQDSGLMNTCVIPNGVDLRSFDFEEDRLACREKLGLSDKVFIIMYVGHLYKWKGVDTLIEAAGLMSSESQYQFFFVGGTEIDLDRYRNILKEREINNVVFCGHKEPSIVPYYIRSADVVVLPNIPTTQESIHFTSPIKLFEYLASGVPIIASDMPSIREIVSDEEVYFFEPANSRDMVDKIKYIQQYSDLANVKAQKAKLQASMYSWESRADRLIDFIS